MHSLSLVAASRDYSFVLHRSLLTVVISLTAEHGLEVHGLQELQHMASVVVAQGPVALWHVGSSQIRD